MKIYFPLVVFPVRSEEVQVCDFVMQGFINEQDARDLYPEAEIKMIEFDEPNANLN